MDSDSLNPIREGIPCWELSERSLTWRGWLPEVVAGCGSGTGCVWSVESLLPVTVRAASLATLLRHGVLPTLRSQQWSQPSGIEACEPGSPRVNSPPQPGPLITAVKRLTETGPRPLPHKLPSPERPWWPWLSTSSPPLHTQCSRTWPAGDDRGLAPSEEPPPPTRGAPQPATVWDHPSLPSSPGPRPLSVP